MTTGFYAILGKSVRSNAGEDMGRIVDIIVSRDGQIRAAIIDFGGFLGIGTRKIAVDWNALDFTPLGKPGAIMLELTATRCGWRRHMSAASRWWWSVQRASARARAVEGGRSAGEVALVRRCSARRFERVPDS